MTMTSSSVRCTALAVALSIAAPSFTLAITNTAHAAPSAADMETARQLVKEGKELREKSQLKPALEKFKAAHALAQTAVTGIELGKTHLLLNELIEAREVFLSVGRIPVASDETSKSKDARAEADKLANEIKPRIPTVKIKLNNAPAGVPVKVTVDGDDIPQAALSQPRAVNPGHRVIVAKAEGSPDARAEIDIKEGETLDVALYIKTPKKKPTPPPEEQPRPPEEQPPPVAQPPPPPPPVYTPPPPPPPQQPKGPMSPLVPVGFVVMGVGVIVGGITGALAMKKADEVKTACPNGVCSQANKPALDETKTFATVSTIGFAAAGVGLVIGIIGLSKGRGPVETAGAYVRPTFGLGTVGLEGAF